MRACAALPLWYLAGSVMAADAPSTPATAGDAALGRRLFLGRAPLQARVRGETVTLPAAASRCINCHSAAGATMGVAIAPPLTAYAARRGGPAFAYDAATMCATLRTGVDPQQVWLAQAMPQFRLSSQECAALWAYLSKAAP